MAEPELEPNLWGKLLQTGKELEQLGLRPEQSPDADTAEGSSQRRQQRLREDTPTLEKHIRILQEEIAYEKNSLQALKQLDPTNKEHWVAIRTLAEAVYTNERATRTALTAVFQKSCAAHTSEANAGRKRMKLQFGSQSSEPVMNAMRFAVEKTKNTGNANLMGEILQTDGNALKAMQKMALKFSQGNIRPDDLANHRATDPAFNTRLVEKKIAQPADVALLAAANLVETAGDARRVVYMAKADSELQERRNLYMYDPLKWNSAAREAMLEGRPAADGQEAIVGLKERLAKLSENGEATRVKAQAPLTCTYKPESKSFQLQQPAASKRNESSENLLPEGKNLQQKTSSMRLR